MGPFVVLTEGATRGGILYAGLATLKCGASAGCATSRRPDGIPCHAMMKGIKDARSGFQQPVSIGPIRSDSMQAVDRTGTPTDDFEATALRTIWNDSTRQEIGKVTRASQPPELRPQSLPAVVRHFLTSKVAPKARQYLIGSLAEFLIPKPGNWRPNWVCCNFDD